MPRIRPRVITALDVERSATREAVTPSREGASRQEDRYLSKLIKYIPAEAIATHQALAGFGSGEYATTVGWLAVALLPFSVAWFFFATKEKGEVPAWAQVILCPIAFAIWMLVVQSPAVHVLFGSQIVKPELGSILLIFATAVMPLVEKFIDLLVKRVK